MDMSWAGLCGVVAILAICITQWIYKWRTPKCSNGVVLPPGSMGLPIVGETLHLIIPSNSIDLSPFIKDRIQRYGTIFRTKVAGRPLVVSADVEFNHFILENDGKLVETWYLDTFAKIFGQGISSPEDTASIHKYQRSLALHLFGVESLREKLLPEFEELFRKTLQTWSTLESVEVKSEIAAITINFGARQLFSYDPESSPEKLSSFFKNLSQGLMSFPYNIPGTAYYKCLKSHKKVMDMMREVLKEKRTSTEKHYRDLLDHMIQDMNTEKYLTDDVVVQLMFSFIFASFDSISTVLALAFKLLAEHPLVLQELAAEHEAILQSRENSDSPITWKDYKSMTFTLQVINEILRLASATPGIFRRAKEDITINGYTIPAGWVIMLASSAVHLSSDKYEDPLTFNPWRWKEEQSHAKSRNFMPFGAGRRQCAGVDYARVFLSTFLHVLVTKYRWTKIKGGKVVRTPYIKFPDGFYFKISEKNN